MWQDNVRKITPYVPGEQPKDLNVIKLNTNENPYPPAPAVCAALSEMEAGTLRLYPSPDNHELVEAMANYHHVSEDRVFVGVGSDDVLSVAFLTFFNGSDPLLIPEISYSFYEVWADLYRIPTKKIPLRGFANDAAARNGNSSCADADGRKAASSCDDADGRKEASSCDNADGRKEASSCADADGRKETFSCADFSLDPNGYKIKNGGVCVANPNAPTSLAAPLSVIREIIEANRDSVVIIDEAYIDFGGETALSLIDEFDNLLVVRTFSKSRSLAGLRIGYCIGSPELIRAMNDVKYSMNSYTMNRTALFCGAKSVDDEKYFRDTIAKIVATRERAASELRKLGFIMPDSSTNFLFVSHRTVPAETIFTGLRGKNIYVRFFNKPLISNYLRITIGTDDQMDSLFAALKEILQQ